jgi:thymidine kinase
VIVKSSRDTRYAEDMVVPHGKRLADGMVADYVGTKLSEVELKGAKVVLIDELHFFDSEEHQDSLRTLKSWQAAGVEVIATTLDQNSYGESMYEHRLREAGIPYTTDKLHGQCAYKGCTKPSTCTSRTKPFDGVWMGGAESYQPTCQEHHQLMDVFINPLLLVENQASFISLQELIYETLQVDNKQFCKLLNAALTAKQAGVPMQVLACGKCGKVHLDEGEWAKKAHQTHLCEHCDTLFEAPRRGVSNLLQVCSPRLAYGK